MPYVVSAGVVPRQTALLMLAAGYVFQIATIPFFAGLSDKFGRKPVLIITGIVSAALVFPMFWMFNSTNPWIVLIAFIFGCNILQSSMFGPIPLIANLIVGPDRDMTFLGLYVIFLFVLSILAVVASRETAGPRANPDPKAA